MRDQADPGAPCSIAACGLALTTIPVIFERGVAIRKFAAKVTRRRLRSLLGLPQGAGSDAGGYKGFFYHFLDAARTVRRGSCARSTGRAAQAAMQRCSPQPLISLSEEDDERPEGNYRHS